MKVKTSMQRLTPSCSRACVDFRIIGSSYGLSWNIKLPYKTLSPLGRAKCKEAPSTHTCVVWGTVVCGIDIDSIPLHPQASCGSLEKQWFPIGPYKAFCKSEGRHQILKVEELSKFTFFFHEGHLIFRELPFYTSFRVKKKILDIVLLSSWRILQYKVLLCISITSSGS